MVVATLVIRIVLFFIMTEVCLLTGALWELGSALTDRWDSAPGEVGGVGRAEGAKGFRFWFWFRDPQQHAW